MSAIGQKRTFAIPLCRCDSLLIGVVDDVDLLTEPLHHLVTVSDVRANCVGPHFILQIGVIVSTPARAGIFIYAKEPARLSGFYQGVLGMTEAHRTNQMVVLGSPDLQLIVHAMPPQVASQVEITEPPQLRDGAAIKFFCTISSLSAAQESAEALGGRILPEQWQGPGFVVRNAYDPEGNIFQIRQSAV